MKVLVVLFWVSLIGIASVLSVYALISYPPFKELLSLENEFEKVQGNVVNVTKRQINRSRSSYVEIEIEIDILGEIKTLDYSNITKPNQIKINDSLDVWYHEDVSLCYIFNKNESKIFPSHTYFIVDNCIYFHLLSIFVLIAFLMKHFGKKRHSNGI